MTTGKLLMTQANRINYRKTAVSWGWNKKKCYLLEWLSDPNAIHHRHDTHWMIYHEIVMENKVDKTERKGESPYGYGWPQFFFC